MVIMVAITFFLMVQYTVIIFFMIKRIDRLAKDTINEISEPAQPESPGK